MRTFDLTPLLRSAVGFDRTSRLLSSALEQMGDTSPTFPPYNIEKTSEDQYRITLAIAGFGAGDIEITVAEGKLHVRGKIEDKAQERKFLHQGIAGRSFERSFQLADYIVVKGAKLANGLLELDLARELPDAMRPRRIPIKTAKAKRLTSKAA